MCNRFVSDSLHSICVSKHNCFSLIDLQLAAYRFAKSPLRLLQRATQCGELAQISPYFVGSKVVPGGGVEPPRYQVPADFESAASASSAIPACEEAIVSLIE